MTELVLLIFPSTTDTATPGTPWIPNIDLNGGMYMYLYEGLLVEQDNGKFLAAILRISHEEPNCDTVADREFDIEQDAAIWLDDEMSRLTSGKGVWDL
jgi:hypothetical protein